MSRPPKGVYSTIDATVLPEMGKRGSAQRKRFWLVWEQDQDYVVVQPLNRNLVPTGQKKLVPMLEFRVDYNPEPDFMVDQGGERVRPIWNREQVRPSAPSAVTLSPPPAAAPNGAEASPSGAPVVPPPVPEEPAAAELAAPAPELESGPPARDTVQLNGFELEMEGRNGLIELSDKEKVLLDEEPFTPKPSPEESPPGQEPVSDLERLRATREQAALARSAARQTLEREARTTFGLGISHLKRGNVERARELLEELAEQQGDFAHEHKHMFNEFGINLRKSKVTDLALRFYRRALELSPQDENIYHNLARVYWEQGDLNNCQRNLEKSLELNPNLEYSARFLRFLARQRKKKRSRFKDLLPLPHRRKK